MDLEQRQYELRHHLATRGATMSLEAEINYLLELWKHEDGDKARALVCLRELVKQESDGLYTEEEWEDRESEWNDTAYDEKRDLEAENESAWSAANSWESRAEDLEEELDSAREDLQEWRNHCARVGTDQNLRCTVCNGIGCHADCGAMKWK